MVQTIRVMVSRHSAFYSPLIATIAGGFLRDEGYDATYAVLGAGQRSHVLLREGVVDVMQSAVSSNWGPMEAGERDLPAHFALINRRDGFFLVSTKPRNAPFSWMDLEGATLLADQGAQPLAMLKYAVHYQGLNWARIRVVEKGDAEFLHLQSPAAHASGTVVASVGAAMPEVAFSTLCASRAFLETDACAALLRAFVKARAWVRGADTDEVARVEAGYFPEFDATTLATAVRAYQEVGCWDGSTEITPSLYEQALRVFWHSGGITREHPYDEVVAGTAGNDLR